MQSNGSASLPAATTEQSQETSDFGDKALGDWWGSRQRLEDAGVSFNGNIVLEGFGNFRGGIDTAHQIGAATVDLNLTLDTDKLVHLPGGECYIDLEDHAGRNPSRDLTGDLQIFDKQNTSPYLQIFELWYQQKLFGGKFRLKIGKVDANTEFGVVDNGLMFLSSSAQVSPTNFVLPTTPIQCRQ